MRKLLILLFLAAVIAFSISGCGGGSGSDPLGTDSLTFESAASQVDPNGTVVLTATVKNASGVAVVGKTVTFGFVKNTSGATAPFNGSAVSTDFDGKALITYKAGLTVGDDIIRASISDRSAEVYITVGSGSVGGGRKIALSGSTTSLAAGKNSILTATVTDSTGNPVSGQTVAFSFISNLSGASPLTVLNSGMTDVSGQAVAVYTAGAGSPGSDIEDTVKAEIVGISSAVLILSRTSATVPLSAKTLSLTASTSSLTAGQSSILAAKVVDQTGKPVSGQVVTFQFLGGVAAPSGATLTTLNSGTTDASGQALAVYTAGATSPTTSVQDTVQASTAGSTGAVIITRTASTAVLQAGYHLAIAADVTSLAAGENAIVTATVTDGSGNSISGQTVTFVLFSNSSGATLTTLSGTTDVSGRAAAVYKAGAASPTASVQDTVQASVTGSTGAIVMTRTAAGSGFGTGVRMTVTATPTSLIAGAMSVIEAQVNNADGTAAAGLAVNFGFVTNNSGATLTSVNNITDASGTAIATYTAGNNSPSLSIQDVVTASVTGSARAVIITRTASNLGTYAVSVGASATSVTAGQVSVITATVTSGSAPAGGVTVIFTLPVPGNSSGATMFPWTATTDGSGKAVVVYQPGTLSPTLSVQDTVQAAVGTATNTVVITRVGSAASAYGITVTASPATLTADNSNSVITANVKNSAGTAISGVTVTFAVTGVAPVGTLSVASATTGGSGDAVTTFTGNGVGATGATSVVTASITVSGNTYTNAVIITYP